MQRGSDRKMQIDLNNTDLREIKCASNHVLHLIHRAYARDDPITIFGFAPMAADF